MMTWQGSLYGEAQRRGFNRPNRLQRGSRASWGWRRQMAMMFRTVILVRLQDKDGGQEPLI